MAQDIVINMIFNTEGVRKNSKKAARAVDGLEKKVNKSVGKMSKGLDQFLGQAPGVSRISGLFGGLSGATLGVAAGIGSIAIAMGSAISSSVAFEKTLVNIGVLLGNNTDLARQLSKDIIKFSAETPKTFQELSGSAQVLLSAGVGSEKIIKTLGKLGDISTFAKGNLEDLAVIFSKNMASGIIQGEDLNQLFDQRLGPLTKEMARIMGTNVRGLKKFASEGKVTFGIFEKAITNVTSEGGLFFQGMAKGSKTVGGLMSTLIDQFSLLGTAFTGVFEKEDVKTLWSAIKDVLTDIIKSFNHFITIASPFLQELGASLGEIFKAVWNTVKLIALIMTPHFLVLLKVGQAFLRVIRFVFEVFNFISKTVFNLTIAFGRFLDKTFGIVDFMKNVLTNLQIAGVIIGTQIGIIIKDIGDFFVSLPERFGSAMDKIIVKFKEFLSSINTFQKLSKFVVETGLTVGKAVIPDKIENLLGIGEQSKPATQNVNNNQEIQNVKTDRSTTNKKTTIINNTTINNTIQRPGLAERIIESGNFSGLPQGAF